MSFVTHLECSRCEERIDAAQLINLCPACTSPLLVRYDLHQIKRHLNKTDLLDRPPDMWRYLEALPVDGDPDIVTLGEGMTPLLSLSRSTREMGAGEILLKDEGCNPTGSFKARGLSAAVSLARKWGARELCIPTAGNAGGALAAYAAAAGLEAHVYMPSDTPAANLLETRLAGAHVTRVDGLISDAAQRMIGENRDGKWFDVSTLKEPYRIEGKKTMGYELAEQLHWKLPDVILYPTGGGTGLIGMWKAFDEMEQLGWIDEARPRMVAVQSQGCAPIVRAFEDGASESQPWENAATFAAGIRVPKALGDFLILDALSESAGHAVAVSETRIFEAIGEVGRTEGVFLCPEGAACWAALRTLIADGKVKDTDQVVIFNTGAGHKYIDAIEQFGAGI